MYTHTSIFPSTSHWDGPKRISTTGVKILPSKYNSTLKGMHLGEMADCRAGEGKVQDELGIPFCARMLGNAQRMMVTCQKVAEDSLKGFPMFKYATIWESKQITVINHNPLNKKTWVYTDINKQMNKQKAWWWTTIFT